MNPNRIFRGWLVGQELQVFLVCWPSRILHRLLDFQQGNFAIAACSGVTMCQKYYL